MLRRQQNKKQVGNVFFFLGGGTLPCNYLQIGPSLSTIYKRDPPCLTTHKWDPPCQLPTSGLKPTQEPTRGTLTAQLSK